MQKDELTLLRDAAEQQVVFLGNLLDLLVMNKQIDRLQADQFVASLIDLTEHPRLKARWVGVRERL